MASARGTSSLLLFATSLVPPVLWLAPAWLARQAPSFRDQGDFFYPLKLYTADRIRRGEIPLWNPLSGAGEPWLANLQSGVFYPPGALFLLPWPALAAALFLLFHFALGAWGTWRFLKDEGISDTGALLGAGFFCGSGLAASLSMYWNHFGAWVYLPAIAWLARSGLRTRGSRLGLALLVGLAAMAGSPELLAGILLFSPFLAWQARAPEGGWQDPPARRRVLRFGVAAALGLALAAWALVPFGELLFHSQRRAGLSAAQRDAGAVELQAFGSALGLSEESGTTYLATLYIGPAILLSAAAALAEKERRRLVFLLLALAAAGIFLAMASPPGAWLRSVPPLDLARYPAKALSLTFFALSVLAGLGIDACRFGRVAIGRLGIALAGLAGLAIVFLGTGQAASRWACGTGVLLLCLLALVAGRFRRVATPLALLAALAMIAGLCLASRGVFRFAPEAELRAESEGVRFLAKVPGRILTPPMVNLAPWVLQDPLFGAGTLRRQRESLLGYTNLLAGVRTIRTAAALPTAGAASLARSIDEASDLSWPAGAASARLLWTPFQPANMGSRKVGDFFRAPINPYRPRLSFVRRYRVEPDPQRAWGLLARGEIDPSREVFLDRAPRNRIADETPKTMLIASLAEDTPERVVADVTSNKAGVLVLTDLAYPGWTAEADGKPAELLRADGFFRAVPVPAGSHRVVFRYRSITFFIGAAVSLAAAATLLAALWLRRPADARSLL